MIELDLRIDDPAWGPDETTLEKTAHTALNAGAKIAIANPGEVCVLLTSNDALQTLNKTWRDKDKATDVLSFPADEQDHPFLGDIAIAYGICAEDAASKQASLAQHLSHLLIHGYLHLLGYDHLEDKDAEEMEALETEALASLGWPDPYKV